MDLTFKALQEDFTGTWPAALHIENAEYAATLFYAGASADPFDDVGEHAADRAAGRLDRKNLTLSCDPKIPGRSTSLDIVRGRVVLRLGPVPPFLDVDATRQLAEDLAAAVASATALDGFITAWFGPGDCSAGVSFGSCK